MGFGPPPVKVKDTFLELDDTPGSYSGQALKLAKVNVGGTALSFDLLLSFTDWYAGGAPTTYPWQFEALLPYSPTYEGHFFSPILKNDLEQYYCYQVGKDRNEFYKYNLTRKQWTRLADLNEAGAYASRPLALSTDGKKLACISGGRRKVEVYDIEANTWTISDTVPQINATDADIYALVWEDGDIIWAFAQATAQPSKFMKYVVSTGIWTQYANGLSVSGPQNMGISTDKTTLYAGGAGASYYYYTKYVISTDTYSTGDVGSQRRFLFCSDRTKLWYTYEGTYTFLYFDCDDETTHDIFPMNPQRTKASNWSFAVFELSIAIFHAREAAPRNMSYEGTGSWRLAEETLTDYNLVVFKKPNDGYSISAVDKVNGYFVPIFLFSTLALPAGTWEFFYPKDGDYTQLVISGSVLK